MKTKVITRDNFCECDTKYDCPLKFYRAPRKFNGIQYKCGKIFHCRLKPGKQGVETKPISMQTLII